MAGFWGLSTPEPPQIAPMLSLHHQKVKTDLCHIYMHIKKYCTPLQGKEPKLSLNFLSLAQV